MRYVHAGMFGGMRATLDHRARVLTRYEGPAWLAEEVLDIHKVVLRSLLFVGVVGDDCDSPIAVWRQVEGTRSVRSGSQPHTGPNARFFKYERVAVENIGRHHDVPVLRKEQFAPGQ